MIVGFFVCGLLGGVTLMQPSVEEPAASYVFSGLMLLFALGCLLMFVFPEDD